MRVLSYDGLNINLELFIIFIFKHSFASPHSHPHNSIETGNSHEKQYYSNIMEIIKGSDLLSPTDSLQTLPQDYDE